MKLLRITLQTTNEGLTGIEDLLFVIPLNLTFKEGGNVVTVWTIVSIIIMMQLLTYCVEYSIACLCMCYPCVFQSIYKFCKSVVVQLLLLLSSLLLSI